MRLPVTFVSHREWLDRPELAGRVAKELAAIRDHENEVVNHGKRKFNIFIQPCEEEGYILVWGDEQESAHEIMSWLTIHGKKFGYHAKKAGEPLRRPAEGRLVTTVELIKGRRYASSL